MSQAEMAKRIGVSVNTYNRWELAKTDAGIRMGRLLQFCHIAQVPALTLFKKAGLLA